MYHLTEGKESINHHFYTSGNISFPLDASFTWTTFRTYERHHHLSNIIKYQEKYERFGQTLLTTSIFDDVLRTRCLAFKKSRSNCTDFTKHVTCVVRGEIKCEIAPNNNVAFQSFDSHNIFNHFNSYLHFKF